MTTIYEVLFLECERNEFVCSNGECLSPGLVCDGNEDCMDGSDEGSHCCK